MQPTHDQASPGPEPSQAHPEQPMTTAIVWETPGTETVVQVSGFLTGDSLLSPQPPHQQFSVHITVAEQRPHCVSKVESVIGTS